VNSRLVFQKANVTQLVEFVRADGTRRETGEEPLNIGGRGGKESKAGVGERDFRSGSEDKGAIRMSMARAQLDNVRDFDALGGEMMHGVGVVPENAEIGCGGLHGGEPPDDCVGIHDAGGVAVFGNAPDGFDGGIAGDEALDFVHVRAVVAEYYGDHANAVLLADGEVAVVAGNGAKKSDFGVVAPGPGAVACSFQKGINDDVVHEGEAGIIADDYLLRRRAENSGEEAARFEETLKATVIAAINAAFGEKIGGSGKREERAAQVELGGRGFAASEIEFETFGFEGVVGLADFGG